MKVVDRVKAVFAGGASISQLERLENLLEDQVVSSATHEQSAMESVVDAGIAAQIAGKAYEPDVGKASSEAAKRTVANAQLVKVRKELARMREREAAELLAEQWSASQDASEALLRRAARLDAALATVAVEFADLLFEVESTFQSVPVKPSFRAHFFTEAGLLAYVNRRLFGMTRGKLGAAGISPYVASQDPSLADRLRGEVQALFIHREKAE